MVDWQVGVDAGCRDGVEDVDEARGELTEVERDTHFRRRHSTQQRYLHRYHQRSLV